MAWLSRYYGTTIGKKFITAVTGVILFGYVVGHMLGNLQIYAGPDQINSYAEFLHHTTPLLWGVRIVLLVAVLWHVWLALQLTLRNRRARSHRYEKIEYRGTDWAARSMRWTGVLILIYVVYHLLHFTTGTVHSDFNLQESGTPDVYVNVLTDFSIPLVALIYIVANALLGVHLYHGLWSLFQTFGWDHPKWNRWRRGFAIVVAVGVSLGFISIPVAVWTGILG